MKIEILGTGCTKCRKLFDQVTQAVQQAGLDAEIVKVERIDEIMKRGLMLTPGLAINGKVVSSGKVPKAKAIAALLESAVAEG